MTLIIQMDKLQNREAKASIFHYVRSLQLQNLETKRTNGSFNYRNDHGLTL